MGTLSLSDYKDVRIGAPWGHISGRWYGNQSERPILAIHGWLDNLGTFDTLIPLLPDYLGVLCIELPGHGMSSRMPPGIQYSTVEYMYIVARIMKEYKWQKVSFLAHSMGAIVSFLYTALAPHTVDLVISLDMVQPDVVGPLGLDFQTYRMEKRLIEEERNELSSMHEPPSYTLSQLRKILSEATNNSVSPQLAQHLLYRSVAKSKMYPEKYYFSRDGRVKFYNIIPTSAGLNAELARRIKQKPYLIIKSSESSFIGSKDNEVISILRKQNPHFELHEVTGGHHVHLTNAKECAKYIVPFLRRHRPPTVSSWSLAGEEQKLSSKERRKVQENFYLQNQKRQSKL